MGKTRRPAADTQQTRLFSWQTLLLVVLCLAVNILGAKLALRFSLPLFLDSAGTILAAALGGGLPGVIVGFVSNVLNSIGDPITLYYGVVSVLLALCATFFSHRGLLRRPLGALLAVGAFSAIGGMLGSLLTWMLYGMNLGEGISAPLALYFHDTVGTGRFLSQFTADFLIDIADKLVTMLPVFLLLRFLPRGLCACLPLGGVYARDAALPRDRQPDTVRVSLRVKISGILIVTALTLGLVSVIIGFIVYRDASDQQHIEIASSAAELAAHTVDGDALERYLDTCEEDDAYRMTESRLGEIRAAFPAVTYLYVIRVCEDGSHVVFDLDAPDLAGSALGTVWENEEGFQPQMDALLKGEPIEPVISHGVYGWLLTVYKPVYDSTGACMAYAAADVSMEQVRADRYEYVIRIIALLFGASIVLVAFTVLYTQERIVRPIKTITSETSRFAFGMEDGDRLRYVKSVSVSGFHTGDEIEELSRALTKTAGDVAQYITEIEQQSADIRSQADVITKLQDNIIRSFADMIENRDENTGHHIRRTAAYVTTLARQLKKEGRHTDVLDDRFCEDLDRSAPLHDIGKIKVSDTILFKPGRLTPEEFRIMQTHTVCGREIIKNVLRGIEGDSYLDVASEMAMHHHEKWDGTGYPSGLAGEDIPLCARLMAIADVFDALLSKRPYKDPIPFDDAVVIIRDGAGRHFDPVMVDAFLHALPEIRVIAADVGTDE